ncbi:MAG TPA: hypothetical protein DCG47_02975 [Spirochaetaceae bacterium]|nr:hypothetical protein [Spirochaetaceae bacterium]
MEKARPESPQPTPAYLTLVSRDFVYDFVSDSYCKAMGVSRDAMLGKKLAELWGAEHFERDLKPALEACFQGQDVHIIEQLNHSSGKRYLQLSCYPYRVGDDVSHLMVFSHDISMVRRLESRLMDLEFKDPLTGLLNRKSFDLVLYKELERAGRETGNRLRALMLINLRDFTQINARHGYEIGDLLFESTAVRVKEALRANDYVFRYEGKELAVILTTLARASDVSVVADTIRERVTFPYNHHGSVINVGCNIGIAVYPDDTLGKDDLLRFASSAMEEARKRDEAYIIFNQGLQRSALRKAKLHSEMRQALVDRQFAAYFQPIVDLGGAVVGAEALIRWDHPALGFVPPDEFIPLAEEAGYTLMIGRWMLYQVCRFIKRHEALLGGRYVSVNLSAKEFGGEGLVDYVRAVIKSVGINPSSIKLEITETESMIDIEDAIDKISRLRELGIEVYVDDFGAGYSSLAYLKRLPASVVKIDRSFTDTLAGTDEDRDFVAGMIRMISGKKMKVLMEGVSSPAQYDILRGLAVDYLQGYYFGKAAPEEAFITLLAAGITLPLPQ